MPHSTLRLALAQLASSPGDVEGNVRAVVRQIEAAAQRGAHLVAFPELTLTGYELRLLQRIPETWVTPGDPRLEPIRQSCRAREVAAIVGAAVRSDEGRPLIASLVFGPDGGSFFSCKENLHGVERAMFEPRLPAPPFLVRDWRVAIAICFDASEPHHAERAAAFGADLYVVSALYTADELRRSDLHLGARAMDHRLFSALANHAGTTGGHLSCGASGVWAPTGDVVASVEGREEALLTVDLEPGLLARFRGAWPGSS